MIESPEQKAKLIMQLAIEGADCTVELFELLQKYFAHLNINTCAEPRKVLSVREALSILRDNQKEKRK